MTDPVQDDVLVARKSFADATAFRRQGEGYLLDFPTSSVMWSVNGGYLAAAALRVAASVSLQQRPVALTAHFLAAVKPGEATATAGKVSLSKSVEIVEVRMSQQDRLCVLAHATFADSRGGPLQFGAVMPLVPHPDELRTLEEILEPGETPPHAFWDAFDQRPINRVQSRARLHRTARSLRWFRYREAMPQDAALSCGRLLPIGDTMGIPAASETYEGPFLTSLAPTTQLTAHFYAPAQTGDWILCDAYGDYAEDGLVSIRAMLWSTTGKLVGHVLSQMVIRPGEGAYARPA